MRTIVSKFGGSSTANAAQLRRILAIIRASPSRRCVVLSAPGTDEDNRVKVTSLLADCWRWRNDRERVEPLLRKICGRFSDIARQLGLPDMRSFVRDEIARALAVSEAHTLSRGEYLCALIFSRYSHIPMLDAADAIQFDGFGDVDAAATRRRTIDGVAARHDRVVVPGFYGADPNGHIVTFPRNGSDITGAIIADSLSAALYENWTDVPGLMTADPMIVPGPRLIPQISYRQMRLLARSGAQVLHPDCLGPVALAGIPTRLRCMSTPECFGTLIDDATTDSVPCIASKSLPDGTACVSVFGISADTVRRAAKPSPPLSLEIDEGVCRLIVPEDARIPCVRTLHAALIENPG